MAAGLLRRVLDYVCHCASDSVESTARQLSPAETSDCFKSSMFRQYEEEQSRIQKSDAQQKNHKAEAELFAPTGTASLKSANRGLSASTDASLAPAVNFAQPQRQKGQARGERWQPFGDCNHVGSRFGCRKRRR